MVWNVLSADLPNTEKLLLLEEFDKILQLDLQNVAEVAGREELAIDELPEVVRELMQQRQDARNKQDWDRADALRVEIEQHGFRLIDTPEGQKVERL